MTEQQPYDVVRDYGTFETRRYPEHVLAEVTVEGPFESAGNRAFGLLFGYITGANATRTKIAMTAPVLQSSSDLMIDGVRRSPDIEDVSAPSGPERYRVAFVLPATLTAASAPVPADSTVQLRTVPESVVAAARFSGSWSAARYGAHREKLRADVRAAGLTAIGPDISARFDPPFMPAFLRHNEVLLEVDPSTSSA
ncbi:SOUL family heme-binding protein [Microbacterium rhizomatis]|uniref:Heme-binding protein n=1 Tax=Microbacterium rhizomatis TaxID=1631477 RepID=A0A5J5J7N7_9MICO|nr:heme-binding protein [Microbacterium rhizomatis]KAA9111144.1 heme-binding protein [Microbacterium rhizomatis]